MLDSPKLIDVIQNFWWKKLVAAQKAFLSTFRRIIFDNSMIPGWLDEKNYQLITCLNTPYKILMGLIAKYMRERTLVNKIWDK